MFTLLVPALLATIITFSSVTRARSLISTFADANCQESITSLDGPNGYPNGTCTDFRRSGQYGSFQVVGLDAGCAVTIYVDDFSGDICSGPLQVASIAACYNATWAFYSIDMCDPAGAGNTNIPSLSRSAISSTSSSSSVSSSTDSALLVTSTSASASTSATAAASSGGSSTGTIVGGVVGGVLGLALIVGATIFLTMRTLAKHKSREAEAGIVNEVHGDSAMPMKQEVYEKMGTLPVQPPVELATSEHDAQAGAVPKTPPK